MKKIFRDRFDELLEFAPALHKFLNEASVDHEIFVINQADKYRFNRASLINVGYIYTADKGFDYLGKRFKRCVGGMELVPNCVWIGSPRAREKFSKFCYI